MEGFLGKECLLKELENKSGIAAWAKDTGSEGEVKERVQAYQKETATQEEGTWGPQQRQNTSY